MVMTRNTYLAVRIREVLLNGRWIANTHFQEQVLSTSWEQAVAQVGELNSIAALTYHINYYLDGILRAMETGVLDIRDKYSFDLPPIQSAAEWDTLVRQFLQNAESFAEAVERMEDSALDLPFIDEKYGSTLRNIEGVIEHSYYHLGQVVLLRKMLS
jgi:hypothetical protein